MAANRPTKKCARHVAIRKTMISTGSEATG